MNKYVVGYLSLSDGKLKQELVVANSKFEAAISYLGWDPEDMGVTTLERIDEVISNMDAFINVLDLTPKHRKNPINSLGRLAYEPDSLSTYNHGLNS